MAEEIVEFPIPGKVIRVEVAVGAKVAEGDVVVVLESMKMENPILAPVSGTIKEIKVKEGQSVPSGAVAAIIQY